MRSPSGTLLAESSLGNRFLFTGRELLEAVAIYDYRNRVYSPVLGRFLQTDPIRFSAGDVNLYRYVGNHPVSNVDPNGLCWNWIKIGVEAIWNALTYVVPGSEFPAAGGAAADLFLISNEQSAEDQAISDLINGKDPSDSLQKVNDAKNNIH